MNAQLRQHLQQREELLRRAQARPRPVRSMAAETKAVIEGMAAARASAAAKARAQRMRALKARASWVVEKIKQREHQKTVQQMLADNVRLWHDINPAWAKYGPELPLWSRGTPGYLAGNGGERSFLLPLVGAAMAAYLLKRASKVTDAGEKRNFYIGAAIAGFVTIRAL